MAGCLILDCSIHPLFLMYSAVYASSRASGAPKTKTTNKTPRLPSAVSGGNKAPWRLGTPYGAKSAPPREWYPTSVRARTQPRQVSYLGPKYKHQIHRFEYPQYSPASARVESNKGWTRLVGFMDCHLLNFFFHARVRFLACCCELSLIRMSSDQEAGVKCKASSGQPSC